MAAQKEIETGHDLNITAAWGRGAMICKMFNAPLI